MVVEFIVEQGHGYSNGGRWFWTVYVADEKGQPELDAGWTWDKSTAYKEAKLARDKCSAEVGEY